MLAHPEESRLADGRAVSDLLQGVTLEVMGEDSMGPLTPKMKVLMVQRQSDVHYSVDWTTLGEYLVKLKIGLTPLCGAHPQGSGYSPLSKILFCRV
jgi:N-acyl-D-amino-acid deacylase